jgi:3-oxoacyl-[acyl-carrier protein] reductase
MAAKGLRIAATYSGNAEGAASVVAACEAAGVDAMALRSNVAEDADCREIVNEVLDRWGRIDVLVNNAGTTKSADQSNLDALDAEDFHRIYGVNVIGPYQMVRAALPALRASGRGSVVNTSSIAGISGIGSSMAYAASKGALNTMTLSMARSLAPEIRVNAVCPGFVDSEWWSKQHDEETTEKLRARARKTTPLRKVVTPEDVAEAIGLFALGGSSVTGQLMVIDNGMLLNIGQPLAAAND